MGTVLQGSVPIGNLVENDFNNGQVDMQARNR
jgi:hypothetical protein